ncbi:hypothetical protein I6E29_02190 [Arcanobacterium haemolyticum]|nr:hypothetical protein [Arcanobacterium haemolyticum]
MTDDEVKPSRIDYFLATSRHFIKSTFHVAGMERRRHNRFFALRNLVALIGKSHHISAHICAISQA